ncbi:MAG: efflux RND transporter periplasmic adaptor subunit [Bacteroidetes bacterium]|nr:efflux RND transporter periplasmic adaptor subunit [Bacteroidota bacterium]
MKNKSSNRKGNLLAAFGVGALLIFLIYSTWIISRPKPIEVQGEVEATQIKVASKLTGRIDSIAVHKGDKIKRGQLLFVIKSPEIEAKIQQAYATLKGAVAQNNKAIFGAEKEDIQAAYNSYLKANTAYELAQKTYERINNLYNEGVLPAQKRDEAESNYKVAQETTNAAKALLEKVQKGCRIEDKDAAKAMVSKAQGAINEVESYLSETRIYAPQDGEVADIIAETGELISAGYPVVTIARLDDSWICFNLREDLLASIKIGSEFNAVFPSLGNKEVKLKVTYIHVLGNFATWNATKTSGEFDMKTFEVHAVPLEKTENLRPGMSALVNWKLVTNKN